ncbi:non-ribosomal peptide synthetase [Pedobacter lusitanus]|uniref:non-ribosomal peptide synthetase n=1 Tax=Pedobacter lusitanus TaxID=1503925 RepID=UPI000A96BBA3|nr:non-ribosomal peptide synthetase [Pedobacter lusitanus]
MGNLDAAIRNMSILTQNEQDKLLTGFSGLDFPYTEKTIVDLFEEQVGISGDQTALVFENTHLTYRELDQRANQLANCLIDEYKVKPGDVVSLIAERSENVIIALLGIMKTGAVYLPVDPGIPKKRMQHILTDAKVSMVITDSSLIFDNDFGSCPLFALDVQLSLLETSIESPGKLSKPNDIAYIIYTSGSTGQPKGVAIRHISISARSVGFNDYLGMTSNDNVLHFASIGFDASIYEVQLALLAGGKLIMAGSNEKNDINKFLELLDKQKISFATLPPAFMKLLERRELPYLKKLVSTGEGAALEDAIFYSGIKDFYNGYGPTETCIGATFYLADYNKRAQYRSNSNIPIGKPFYNTKVLVLDKDLALVPIGIPGELYVSGVGLSPGYINNENFTKERFLANPYSTDDKDRVIYKTGDLGKWNEDGELEYLGRVDDQVQIHGMRVELGEIEQVLMRNEFVKEAIVIVYENEGNKELVAYWVNRDERSSGIISSSDFKDFLRQYLPMYMIPAQFICLDAFPLNSNGKTDKKSLPDPAEFSNKETHIEPRNEEERQLLQIWKEVLKKENIGIRDNFFDVGGNSLNAVQISTRIYKSMNSLIEVKIIFSNPTIEHLASIINTKSLMEYQQITPIEEKPFYEISNAQKRLWILAQVGDKLAYNMPLTFILKGDLNRTAFQQAFEKLIDRHEVLRSTFKLIEGEPRQLIKAYKETGFEVGYINLDNERISDQELQELVTAEAQQVFDFEQGPLLRAKLVKLKDEEHLFLFTIHHIVADHWSMQIIVSELTAFYNDYSSGKIPVAEPLKIQYKDYASWINNSLSNDNLNIHQQYWLNKLQGELPVLNLPKDYEAASGRTSNGDVFHFTIAEELTKNLKDLAARYKASLYMTLLSAVNVLLFKYSDQTDILIGTSTTVRKHMELEDQVGLYLNQIVLRGQFNPLDSFAGLLDNIKEVTLEAYEHQIFPLDTLIESLNLKSVPGGGANLFDVMVDLQEINSADEGKSFDGIEVENYDTSNIFSRMDLTFNFKDYGQEIEGGIIYCKDLFSTNTIKEQAGYLIEILETIVQHPELTLVAVIKLCDNKISEIKGFQKLKKRENSLRKLMDL